MTRDNVVYTICGLLLGLTIGSFLIGPKLAQSKLAGGAETADAAAPAQAMPPDAAVTNPAANPNTAGMPAGNQMEMVRQQIQSLKDRIAKDPKDVDALVQLANMYMDVSKFPQAIQYYNQALTVRDDANIRTDLGICYKQAGQLDNAYTEFNRVAQQNPNEWQAVYNLAIVLAEMRRGNEARAQLARLKQMRPNDPDVMKLEQALSAVK